MANTLLKRERSNVVARSFSATIDGKLIPANARRTAECFSIGSRRKMKGVSRCGELEW
jgi:hypothetical protein